MIRLLLWLVLTTGMVVTGNSRSSEVVMIQMMTMAVTVSLKTTNDSTHPSIHPINDVPFCECFFSLGVPVIDKIFMYRRKNDGLCWVLGGRHETSTFKVLVSCLHCYPVLSIESYRYTVKIISDKCGDRKQSQCRFLRSWSGRSQEKTPLIGPAVSSSKNCNFPLLRPFPLTLLFPLILSIDVYWYLYLFISILYVRLLHTIAS